MLASTALSARQPYSTAAIEAHLQQPTQLTPLERLRFARLPKNREIVAFLRLLYRQSPELPITGLGRCAHCREIAALIVAKDGMLDRPFRRRDSRLRVLTVGSQHGRETSGAEALQMLLRVTGYSPLPVVGKNRWPKFAVSEIMRFQVPSALRRTGDGHLGLGYAA
jgi:hypothetical protein